MMPASYSQLINPQNVIKIVCAHTCVCVCCVSIGVEGRRKEKKRESNYGKNVNTY